MNALVVNMTIEVSGVNVMIRMLVHCHHCDQLHDNIDICPACNQCNGFIRYG